jgi:hypothetical protein
MRNTLTTSRGWTITDAGSASSASITKQPYVSSTNCVGKAKVYSVDATGSNLSYLWSNGNAGSSALISSAGTYFVTITGTCGTVLVSSPVQVAAFNCSTTGLAQDTEGNDSPFVYPNPNHGIFTIDVELLGFKNIENLAYVITATDGKVLITGKLGVGKNSIATTLARGIYFLNVSGNVRKLIIE